MIMIYFEIIQGKPLPRKNQIPMNIVEGFVKTLVEDIEERRNICLDQANPCGEELPNNISNIQINMFIILFSQMVVFHSIFSI